MIAERASTSGVQMPNSSVAITRLAIVGSVLIAILGVSLTLFGIDPTTKAGGLVLGGVLCLALTHWIGQVMRTGSQTLLIRAMFIAGGLCVHYSASYFAVDRIVADSLPLSNAPEMEWLVASVIISGFVGMFTLHFALSSGRASVTLDKWHIHASNGFYMENSLRRVFEPLTNR